MDADRAIHEPKPPSDSDAPFTFSMEGYRARLRPPSFRASARRAGTLPRQSANSSRRSAGPLAGGDPGVRLFDASGPDGNTRYVTDVPEPFVPKDGLFLVAPFYHIFGSDEMSLMTPEVRELAPTPYVALCGKDMARLHLSNNDAAVLTVGGSSFRLAVRMHPERCRRRRRRCPWPAGRPCDRVPRLGGSEKGSAMMQVVIHLVIVIAVIAVVLGVAANLIWLERRLLGLFQDRYGPNGSAPSASCSPSRTWSKSSSRKTGYPLSRTSPSLSSPPPRSLSRPC